MFCGDLEQRLIVSIQKKERKEMYQLTQQSSFLKRKQVAKTTIKARYNDH